MPELRRASRIYIVLLSAMVAVFVVGGLALGPPPHGSWDLAVAIAAGIAVASRFPLSYTFHQKIYADGAVAMAAMLLLDPPVACSAVALGTIVGNLAADPRDHAQALFNGAHGGLTTAVGGLLLVVAGWSFSPAALAEPRAVPIVFFVIAVTFLVNATAVTAIVALESQTSIAKIWERTVLREPMDALGFAALNGLGAVVAAVGDLGWIPALMALPALAVAALFRTSLRAQAVAQVALDGMSTTLAQAQRIAGFGSFEWDVATGRHRWSDQTYAILGVPHEPLAIQHDLFLQAIHPTDRVRVEAAFHLAGDGGAPLFVDARIVRRDGTERLARLQAELVSDGEGGTRMVGVVHDVTEQMTLKAELLHRVSHDPLTGIANRAAVLERLDELLGPGHRAVDLAAVFLDLDDFKQINDTLGHAAGDRLLIEVAARLRGCLAPGDVAARFGGDEFVVLLVGRTRLVEVREAADRIGTAIRRPFPIGDRTIDVCASIGLAATSDRLDPDHLLSDADTALYQAKSAGKNRTVILDSRLVGDIRDRRSAPSTRRGTPGAGPVWTSYLSPDGLHYSISGPPSQPPIEPGAAPRRSA